ncbi:hypothetical protein ACHRVZ_02935 [Flavobacterium sp. FlaQc-57]|uniref:hypothetical protein n=1 Tax=Flavobacterium sp. FlaQc-57 TaxID=3374186 RepID=UPI0037563FFA
MEIESYEKVNILTEQLSNSINEIKILSSQIENLKNINNKSTSNSKTLDKSEISKKDYLSLINFLNTQPNKEKLIFSLHELINELKINSKAPLKLIQTKATYQIDMQQLINLIINRNLAKKKYYQDENDQQSLFEALELGPSFKDFLTLEV